MKIEDYINLGELGCWIDGSHMSATDLDLRIIQTAVGFGFGSTLSVEDKALYEGTTEEISPEDIAQDLYDLAQCAIEWMNDAVVPQGFYFYIDDSCLYLAYKDEEGTQYNV